MFVSTRQITCEYGPACYRKKPEHLRYKIHQHLDRMFPRFLVGEDLKGITDDHKTQLKIMKKTLEDEEEKERQRMIKEGAKKRQEKSRENETENGAKAKESDDDDDEDECLS